MSSVQSISDPNYVKSQYRDASHLNARIRLHREFSTNQYGWYHWLFDHFKLVPQDRVLELGCGTGDLWLENLERIPAGSEIILSDFSAGMVAQAQHNLRNSPLLCQYKVIDAQAIPFDNDRFDIVIAAHMLFHVPDSAKCLQEIRRILKPTGRFYASTTGCDHLIEMRDLITRFAPQFSSWGKLPSDSFTLKNGAAQLGEYFTEISLSRYPDSLIVTDAQLLTDYLLSGRIVLSEAQQADLAKFVGDELDASGGKVYVTKDSGVFESSGIKQV